IGVAIGGLFLVRRSVALATLEQHNDVAGFIIAVIGVLYAVLLGFIVVVMWQQFDEATKTAATEAELLSPLYRDAAVFPDDTGRIRADLRRYAENVVTREWDTM